LTRVEVTDNEKHSPLIMTVKCFIV
jgi:hypothetical protein